MKNFVLSFAMIVAMAISSHATVWRINSTPGTSADFTSAQVAHDYHFVLAGDTLYIAPSPGSYGDFTLTKKLVIIGNGLWASENPETQADVNYSQFNSVSFNPGSQGSIIQGCKIYSVRLKTSEIVIQRNYILLNTYNPAPILFDSDNLSNIIIRNNYIINTYYGSNASYVIRSNKSGISNIIISNNFLEASMIYASQNCLNLISGFSGIVENNVIYGHCNVYNTQFNNNILRDGTFTQSNTTYHNNIGNSTQFGTENGNKIYADMVDVFVGEGSTDGQWQLKQGSQAIGAGVGGIDCGMFGGNFPFVLSGIPAIPAIYEFNHDTDYENQLIEVEISVKSHN